MRKFLGLAAFSALLSLAVPASLAAPPATPKAGTLVIVFKDGHHQSFNLADIARVEFPAGAAVVGDAAPANTLWPSRIHFVGKWEVGDGNGGTFFITLDENGDAYRSLREIHGAWKYVNGEAQITWDDGPLDAIRKVGSKFQKFAYAKGKSFTDTPDNVTAAHTTTPRPI